MNKFFCAMILGVSFLISSNVFAMNFEGFDEKSDEYNILLKDYRTYLKIRRLSGEEFTLRQFNTLVERFQRVAARPNPPAANLPVPTQNFLNPRNLKKIGGGAVAVAGFLYYFMPNNGKSQDGTPISFKDVDIVCRPKSDNASARDEFFLNKHLLSSAIQRVYPQVERFFSDGDSPSFNEGFNVFQDGSVEMISDKDKMEEIFKVLLNFACHETANIQDISMYDDSFHESELCPSDKSNSVSYSFYQWLNNGVSFEGDINHKSFQDYLDKKFESDRGLTFDYDFSLVVHDKASLSDMSKQTHDFSRGNNTDTCGYNFRQFEGDCRVFNFRSAF